MNPRSRMIDVCKAILVLQFALIGTLKADITVTIVLDEFDFAQSLDTGSGSPAQSTVTDAGLLGGERIFDLTTTSPSIFNRLRTGTFLGNTDLLLSTEPGDSSTSVVTYDGTDANGLNSYDVTIAGGTHFFMRMDNLDSEANWTLRLTDMSDNSDSSLLSLSAGSSDILMPFSNFSGVDLTDLKEISFSIQSTEVSGGLDFALDSFGVGHIPEPSTSILLLGTLVPTLLRRRRPSRCR